MPAAGARDLGMYGRTKTQILRVTRLTGSGDAQTIYELPVPATAAAVVAATGTFGNFVVNLAQHWQWLFNLLGMH